jgi:hypothetical protein
MFVLFDFSPAHMTCVFKWCRMGAVKVVVGESRINDEDHGGVERGRNTGMESVEWP